MTTRSRQKLSSILAVFSIIALLLLLIFVWTAVRNGVFSNANDMSAAHGSYRLRPIDSIDARISTPSPMSTNHLTDHHSPGHHAHHPHQQQNESTTSNAAEPYSICNHISLIAGAIGSDNSAESVSLLAIALSNVTLVFKIYLIIWYQRDILQMMNDFCVYSVHDRETFIQIRDKLKFFMKFFTAFAFSAAAAALCSIVAHIGYLGRERRLFFNIGFPIDYKTNETAFWLALAFNSTEEIVAVLVISFSTIGWYLMVNCAFKYETLGNRLRTLGSVPGAEKSKLFYQNLKLGIKSFRDIRDSINHLESFFSTAFSIQIATSALSICGSTYCLAYKNIDNLVEFYVYVIILLYNVFDTFMVMYFGNEITHFSGKLAYSLFESNWMDQPIPCRKAVIIFGEHLRQPQQLTILKVFPLTLETFTRILRAAYNMFNILSNIAH